MAYVHVAHDCHINDNAILVNSVQLGGHVEIGKFAIIGGTSAIHQFVKIGQYSMISGGSLVRKDVPPFIKVARDPLSFVGVNNIGLERNGFSKKKIEEIQKLYRVIFKSSLNYTNAVEKIEKKYKASEERNQIIDFIKSSERGIIKSNY